MITKRKNIGVNQDRYRHLRGQLGDILTLRAQGMLTQQEYEEKLEEVEQSLPQRARLAEYELTNGKTRFVLRAAGPGHVLGEFEFRQGHPVES